MTAEALGHVTVVGAGPAGMLLASSLSGRGVRVTIVDPRPSAPWAAQYACWARELTTATGLPHRGRLAAALDASVAARYDAVTIAFDGVRTASESYVALDGERLRGGLSAAFDGEVISGTVTDVTHSAESSTVHHTGGKFSTDLVVDCTGSGVLLPARKATVFQTAYGLHARLTQPWPHGAVLMDFRPLRGGLGGGTFLYALPFPDGSVLLEETALAARPAISLEVLEARLTARLAEYGVTIASVIRVERCRIAMDAPLPEPTRVVAFGAAAGYVHPATGYQVGYCMRMAPQVADAVAQAMSAGLSGSALSGSALSGSALSGSALSAATWDAVWPADARAAHTLYRFGAEAMLRLDETGTRRFFDAFFSMPQRLWSGYLQRTLDRSELLGAMWQLFRRAPWSVRLRLQAAALADPSELIRGIIGRRVLPEPSRPSVARGEA